MKYRDLSVPGQFKQETLLGKGGILKYMQPDGIHEEPNKEVRPHVVALQVHGVPEDFEGKYGVYTLHPKKPDEFVLLNFRWKTLAQAKTAATTIALIAPENWAAAVIINYEIAKPKKTQEADPEMWHRDHYEGNYIIPPTNPDPEPLQFPTLTHMREE